MSNTNHIRSLDGIRGLAIVAVVLCHTGEIVKEVPHLSFLHYGADGVDLFFVLSGFLITSILVRERDRPRYFRNFYLRRAFRIWPLYYLYLALMLAMVTVLPHLSAYERLVSRSGFLKSHPLQIVTPVFLCILFAQNLWFPSLFSARDTTSVTWSLCIEEQFYLIWPLLVKLISPRRLKLFLLIVIVSQPILREFVFLSHADMSTKWQTVTRFPLFHLDGIAAGSLLALVWTKLKDRSELGIALWVTLAACVPLAWLFMRTSNALTYSVAMLISVCIVMFGLLRRWEKVLTWAPLVFLGTISYGLYLIHPVVFLLFQSRSIYSMLGFHGNPQITELCAACVAIAVSVALAALSRFTFESFFLSLKKSSTRGENKKLLVLSSEAVPD